MPARSKNGLLSGVLLLIAVGTINALPTDGVRVTADSLCYFNIIDTVSVDDTIFYRVGVDDDIFLSVAGFDCFGNQLVNMNMRWYTTGDIEPIQDTTRKSYLIYSPSAAQVSGSGHIIATKDGVSDSICIIIVANNDPPAPAEKEPGGRCGKGLFAALAPVIWIRFRLRSTEQKTI